MSPASRRSRAGLPVSVSGTTIDRKCASGLQTIAFAAQRLRAGEEGIYVAGGLDSVSLVLPNKNLTRYKSDGIAATMPALYWTMIETADHVATKYGISREAQDEYGFQSQQRTAAGQANGRFDAEIVPITATQAPDRRRRQHHRPSGGDAGQGRRQPRRHDAGRPADC